MPWASFSLHTAPSSVIPHFWDRLQCPPPQGPNMACWTKSEGFQWLLRKGTNDVLFSVNSANVELQKALVFLRCPSKEGIYGSSSSFLLPSHFGFQTATIQILLFHQPGMPEVPWSLQRSSECTKLCPKVPKANIFSELSQTSIICHRFNEAWQCFAIPVSPITGHASIYPHLL